MRKIIKTLALVALDLIRASVLLGGFGSLVAALLALLGRIRPGFDIVAHFALAGFLVSLLALVLALVTRMRGRWSPVALAAAGALVWGSLIAPEYLRVLGQQRVAPQDETLTVMQFNLWGANVDPKGTAAAVLKVNADVLVLEETADSSFPIIQALKARYPYQTGCRDPYPCSTMILSKVAPLASGGYAIPFGRANMAWATLPGKDGPFTVVGVHHSWPNPIGAQAQQVGWTAETLKQFDQSSLILAGDFNSTPWSRALKVQDRSFGLRRRTFAVASWPARVFDRRPIPFPAPLMPLDHVYAGEAWKTVAVRRGPRLGSDHYPVLVTLTRAGPPVAKDQGRS